MWEWIYQLESEKFDLTEKMKRQKYEVRPSTGNIYDFYCKNERHRNLMHFLFQINVLLNRIQHAQKL